MEHVYLLREITFRKLLCFIDTVHLSPISIAVCAVYYTQADAMFNGLFFPVQCLFASKAQKGITKG